MSSTRNSWSQPNIYPADRVDFDMPGVVEVIDPIEGIIDDVIEYRNPDKSGPQGDLFKQALKSEMLDDAESFGNFVHFPWSSLLVRYPEEGLHKDLRTYRNKHLVTDEEQHTLGAATIANIGLSVGSNIVDTMSQAGIGEHYLLADRDIISPTNLNRIRANMAQVGMMKTAWSGQKLSELDPYIKQTHIEGGFTDETEDIFRSARPNLIIEEVDDVVAKAKIRKFASETRTPLIMVGDIDDTIVMDVERHDIEGVKPFNGKISKSFHEDIMSGNLSKKDRDSVLLKLNGGLKTISPRLVDSAIRRDVDISGFPQLGSTASAGASLATVAAREILLGRKMESGTYTLPMRKVIGAESPTSMRENLNIFMRYLAYRKQG